MNPNSATVVANIQKLNDSGVVLQSKVSFVHCFSPTGLGGERYGFFAIPEKIPNIIILQIPNGRETHVRFKKAEQSLENMKEFKMVCRGLIGSIMIFSYLGGGKFMVNFLKDDMCEVIYHQNKTIPRGTVYDQDLTNGIGWKFLVYLNTEQADKGEVAIPNRFWRVFGRLLPEKIQFYMRNGTMYTGTCSTKDRKVFVLSDLIADYGLSRSEKLLLTYFGEGNFFVMVFESHEVESMLLQDSEADIDDDMSNIIEATVEENEDNVVAGLDGVELNNDQMEFATIMSACNVNNSSHGPYIPRDIHPGNRHLVAGDRVLLRTEHDEWEILIVISNGNPRFSGGWNRFCRDNAISFNETLVFTLLQDDGIVFSVNFPGRN